MDKSTARVNEAVAIAVRRTLDAKPDVENRNAYGYATGKRISGAYGAALRKLADARPSLTAEELVAIVIAPTEFPWDAEATELRDTIEAGARDSVRKRNYGTPVDLSIPIPDDISQRVAALRALIPDKPSTFQPPERIVVDRENLRVVPPSVYAAAEEGKRMFAESRKARLNDRNANEAAK